MDVLTQTIPLIASVTLVFPANAAVLKAAGKVWANNITIVLFVCIYFNITNHKSVCMFK